METLIRELVQLLCPQIRRSIIRNPNEFIVHKEEDSIFFNTTTCIKSAEWKKFSEKIAASLKFTKRKVFN